MVLALFGRGPACKQLVGYLKEKVPLDTETGVRVTGNPLMLSMVISIFESRQQAAHEPAGAKGATTTDGGAADEAPPSAQSSMMPE